MNTMPMPDKHDVINRVQQALVSVSPDVGPVDANTSLIGSAAVLDSLGFVTLLVSLEESLDGRIDLAASFMEHGTEDTGGNPFRTIGTLADHITKHLAQPE